MRVSKHLDVELEPEEWRRLQNGEPISIPIEQEQFLNVYPPEGDEQ
jgi:hypothetical protein